jgi:hypothetical protein
LLHVSVQSPSSGSVLFELAKVMVIKIIHRCGWFGGVAAYFIGSVLVCVCVCVCVCEERWGGAFFGMRLTFKPNLFSVSW